MNEHGKNILIASAFFLLIVYFVAGQARSYNNAANDSFKRPGKVMDVRAKREGKMENPRISDIPRMQKAQKGLWGGEHISLEVTERGGRVEYDCAHGTIARRIVTDRQGRFDVPGTHVEEHGGPVRENARSNSYSVRFIGQIHGTKMKLTVRRSDTKKIIGTFTVVFGQEPSLVKCL